MITKILYLPIMILVCLFPSEVLCEGSNQLPFILDSLHISVSNILHNSPESFIITIIPITKGSKTNRGNKASKAKPHFPPTESTALVPWILTFQNLHLTESIKAVKVALKGRAGIYAIVCVVTGAIYVGSSIYLYQRFTDHIIEGVTNSHLQSAISNYGLQYFSFHVIEFIQDVSQLLVREQYYLDILFSTLPATLIYNYLQTAGSSFGFRHSEETKAKLSKAAKGNTNALGNKHSEETKAKMSDANSGENNPIFGKPHSEKSKAKISAALKLIDRSGVNHPIYGRTGEQSPRYGVTPTNAVTVYLYSTLDNSLVTTFSSQDAAAKAFSVHRATISNYIRSGKIFQGKYILRNTPLLSYQ